MFKKLSERFPAAASRLESFAGAASPGGSTSDPPPAPTGTGDSKEDGKEDAAKAAGDTAAVEGEKTTEAAPPALFPPPEGGEEHPAEQRTASFKAALAERLNSESVSAAASVAATSMMGFMKKAQSAASVAAREGAAKATVWKNKALDAADMDALQRRLSYALDRSTGEVNLDLLNFSYITDNVVAMGFPSMNLGTNRTLLRDNPIDLVAMYMNSKHSGHYMIWNLSEETYDYAYFDNQVLEFNFPGHPAPPLGLMFKICSSIENWLIADEDNLAVIHCLTGKGRTGTVIACYLAWVGLFPNALESLEYVAEKRNSSVEKLTIPSQRRYIQYFNNVMDGVKPHSSPLLLRRVIINTIPVFGTRRVLEPVTSETADGEDAAARVDSETPAEVADANEELHEKIEEGCCPYLQVFKGGKLVFTTTWRDMENGSGVQWASTTDGSVSFNVNCMLQGDILVRCRHLTDSGERVSMFRGAFHTGYIPQGILRLTKAQLDGACGDDRFDQDFFVDLIFADVETDGAATSESGDVVPKSEGVALTEEDKQAYDDMLHRDEAFWVDIEARKVRLQKQREEQLKKKEAAAAAAAAAAAEAEAKAKAAAEQAEAELKAQQEKARTISQQSSFSISGADDDTQKSPPKPPVNRRGSWDEEKDKELMSELESLTQGSLEKAAANLDQGTASAGSKAEDDSAAGLAKEFEDMKKLEKELGLEAYSADLAALPDGKLDPQLALLDKELQGMDGMSPKAGSADDVMNFGADDFDELEEYLSGLSSSTKS